MKGEILPLAEIGTKTANIMQSPSSSSNQNDKIIFEELKQLILEGDWETLIVKLIEYDQFPINFLEEACEGYSLLHYAASRKKVECLRLLITEFSAEPNIRADNGYAPIHLLVSSDCRCEPCTDKVLNCLQILISGGANVDVEDGLGETPLYGAARNRLCAVSGFLLANGANINHWVDGTSVATLLAQFVPDVLKTEFDRYITIDSKDGAHRSLRLDFRLLLQDGAVEQGLTMNSSLTPPPRSKRIVSLGRAEDLARNGSRRGGSKGESRGKERESVSFINDGDRNLDQFSTSSVSRSTLSSVSSSPSSPSVILPKETELLNYLLKADFEASEAVVSHPLVEAFVHLKWLSVRKLFFFLRSLYLFFISLYTFYVFDTFVNATCFYNPTPSSNSTLSAEAANGIFATSGGEQEQMEVETRVIDGESGDRATFGSFIPSPSGPALAHLISGPGDADGSRKQHNFYRWHSFSDYFKAHEMTCEPHMRTEIMAYIFASCAVIVVLYELYKCFESWYDYFKSPLNFAWWLLAFNIGVTVVPGLGFYAHSWHYPYAAFSLVYGWILVLAQIARMPYMGIFVGVFVKVLKDFILLLLTFSPVLLAFALGFSVMLPQNEFFRFIPTGLFKVFLMMTGDVDFWGVFRGTWTTSEHQGHVYIPLFAIYTVYILTVTMVLMSLLLGLAVDNIQEVRREAALYRTVNLIQEIGIFESILHKPAVYYCGFSKYFRRLFSITSLDYMKGPELITFPEDPRDETLPSEIKTKLLPYLMNSCCCSESSDPPPSTHHHQHKHIPRGKKGRSEIFYKVENRKDGIIVVNNASESSGKARTDKKQVEEMGVAATKHKSSDTLRKQFLENGTSPGTCTPATRTITTTTKPVSGEDPYHQVRNRQLLKRDLEMYQDLKLLLEDNENLRNRLEKLKRKLTNRR